MSATPRDIRRLAFQALYQLDARGGSTGGVRGGVREVRAEHEPVRASSSEDQLAVLEGMMADVEDADDPRYTAADVRKAVLLASAAYADRERADAFMVEAAPGWPAHRQAAVDRAILRLAHHEMVSGHAPPKVAVNEAVELAKTFSTEKSPAFINGLLDKLLKQVLGAAAEHGVEPLPPSSDVTHPGANPES